MSNEKSQYGRRSQAETERIFWANPALVRLYELTRSGETILDCGCGDGRILRMLWRPDAKFFGVDVSPRGVERAKARFKSQKNVQIIQGDLHRNYYGLMDFDVVYSTYVIEHVDNPELVIEKMVAHVKKAGLLVLICPNYGSPTEYSPGSPKPGETLKTRALKIFMQSFWYTIFPPRGLNWRRVNPLVLESKRWMQDAEVRNEPYVMTLKGFLEKRGMTTLEMSSGITGVNAGFGLLGLVKRVCLGLGKFGVWPFKYFGPTLLVVASKKK